MLLDIFGQSSIVFSIKSAFLVLLVAFVPITVFSFFRFRLKKKMGEFDQLMKLLQIKKEDANVLMPDMQKEYSANDYFLPVMFATFINFMGCLVMVFGGELHAAATAESPQTLFLSGQYFGQKGALSKLVHAQSLMMLGMAFTGAYIISAQQIIRRLVYADLTPNSYYSSGMRILFAGMVALVMSFIVSQDSEIAKSMLPAIAFLTGIFPSEAMYYIRQKLKIYFVSSEEQAHSLPLRMIEGMSMFHSSRLEEVGIDNAQNLAEANFIELQLRTPFSSTQQIDWILQAKLYVIFKSDITKIRTTGIRTVSDLKAACADAANIETIAANTGIPALTIQLAYNEIKDDVGIIALERFRETLTSFGEKH